MYGVRLLERNIPFSPPLIFSREIHTTPCVVTGRLVVVAASLYNYAKTSIQ